MTIQEIKAAQASIDRVYQKAKEKGYLIPGELREILHDEYNRLTNLKNALK